MLWALSKVRRVRTVETSHRLTCLSDSRHGSVPGIDRGRRSTFSDVGSGHLGVAGNGADDAGRVEVGVLVGRQCLAHLRAGKLRGEGCRRALRYQSAEREGAFIARACDTRDASSDGPFRAVYYVKGRPDDGANLSASRRPRTLRMLRPSGRWPNELAVLLTAQCRRRASTAALLKPNPGLSGSAASRLALSLKALHRLYTAEYPAQTAWIKRVEWALRDLDRVRPTRITCTLNSCGRRRLADPVQPAAMGMPSPSCFPLCWQTHSRKT
jgi:hypothetical protein